MRYNPAEIEPKWQQVWDDARAFETPTDLKTLQNKPKYYVLDMFPYPSGAGLHVGHPEGYTATDVIARMKRMQGFNVMHPMGWDAFGLPAERAAVRENIHPAVITKQNIATFKRQIKRLGFSYDWSREVSTSDVSYYKWTQWIFLKLYEKGLAYLAEVPVNWCPALGTVLANEEVKDGRYVETGDLVEKRMMRQWMLKITAYAERLVADLDDLDWPAGVKDMQRNWIGKSEGTEIDFKIKDSGEQFTVYTTRHDTLFGVTFCVLAPEHPIVDKITTASQKKAVGDYKQKVAGETEAERTAEKEKSGVFTGAYAVHPITNQAVPIWIADYVLMNYGTGAVMGVPSNDERDAQFAEKYSLPTIQIIESERAINSDFLNGLDVESAKNRMADHLEAKGIGRRRVQYRLRDWLFSRQRYWGEPFPIVYLPDGSPVPLPEDALPVELPMLESFKPTDDGQPPLARASESWLKVKLPDGQIGTRETNTMPQWAGSCWYYLRYLDPNNDQEFCRKDFEQYWMPIDLYVGGVEHAVLHLLYARFWHKVLYDCGVVHTKEPFQKLFNQGMILAHSYQDEQGKYYYPHEVEQKGDQYFAKSNGRVLKTQIEKMSKSRYNVVNPDDVIAQYGADAMRLYELFMGPLEQVKPWQMAGVEGVNRFLHRTWRLVVDEETSAVKIPSPAGGRGQGEGGPALNRSLHKTIKKVTEDIEALRFNTAISQMMIFVNEATAASALPPEIIKPFLKVLSPFAPHVCEELWQRLGETTLLAKESWPSFDPGLVEEDTIAIVLQVNGKRRDEIHVPKGLDRAGLEQQALKSEVVQKFMAGATPKKVVVVPGRLVNIVV